MKIELPISFESSKDYNLESKLLVGNYSNLGYELKIYNNILSSPEIENTDISVS